MKKVKYLLVGVIVIMLVMSTTGSLGFNIVENKNARTHVKNSISSGAVLEVTTDKIMYSMGESVIIFLTNVGDETLSGGGPIITIYNNDNEIVYEEATYCWHELEPGEYITWPPWNQTNQQGNQVPIGKYFVEGFLSGGVENYVDNATFYISNNDDELDQYQTEMDFFAPVGVFPLVPNVNYMIAQSFIPQKEIFTRVELMAGRNSTTTYDYNLAIRDDLYGADLASVSVPATNFVVENFSWVEFDFDNIMLTIGQTYYMVSYTANETDNWYAWGAKLADVYPNGTCFASLDDGQTWEEETDADMTFKTYGRDNSPPEIPTIDGPTEGKAGKTYPYTFVSEDPDEDEVYYYIEWGDGQTEEWVGPYASGDEVTLDHTWSEQGDYTIRAKAKDVYDAESDWGTLEITMPKDRPSNMAFFEFLERLMDQFPFLEQILLLFLLTIEKFFP